MLAPADPAPDPTPVVVARFSSASTAEVCCGALLAAGLHPTLADGNLGNADWLLITALGGLRVCVPAEEAADARTLIAHATGTLRVLSPTDLSSSNDRACPRCGSPATQWFRPRAPLWATLSLLCGVPIFTRRKLWRCASCSHAWDPREEAADAAAPTTELERGAPRWGRPGDERVISAPWQQAGLAWRYGALAGFVVVVLCGGVSPISLALALAAMTTTVVLAAAVSLRWNVVVLTERGLRIERGDEEIEHAYADVRALRRPEGPAYLAARGAPIVVGPDAELYAEGALELRAHDLDWLWNEIEMKRRG